MRKWWKHNKNSIVRGVLTAACAMMFFVSQKSVCFAEATGTVKAPTAYIRTTPDKNSEPVGSTSSGKTITIIGQTTDSSGYVWYEVHVEDNKTGYIRSDLVDVDSSSGTIPTSSSAPAQSSEQPASTASGAEIPPETGMDAQYATIKVQSGIVRSAASKNKSKVDSLPQNTQVIVSGQTEGSDMTWYYITFTGTNGEEKTGYVRSDVITLGEMVPVEEPQQEEPQEAPEVQDTQPEVSVHQDYELKYEYDEASGGEVWKIYDYTASTEYAEVRNVKAVLDADHARSVNSELDAKTISKQRIVIIVLIAVIIILAVVMTIMIFKLRDAYYEEYEDDEDEEEEEEEDRRKARRREAEETKRSEGRSSSGKNDGRSERRREREEREEPVRRKSSQAREERQPAPRKKSAETDRRMPEREVSYEEEAAEPVKTAPKKKAKNFMIDDDDFEFEFLNTKNKDKDL